MKFFRNLWQNFKRFGSDAAVHGEDMYNAIGQQVTVAQPEPPEKKTDDYSILVGAILANIKNSPAEWVFDPEQRGFQIKMEYQYSFKHATGVSFCFGMTAHRGAVLLVEPAIPLTPEEGEALSVAVKSYLVEPKIAAEEQEKVDKLNEKLTLAKQHFIKNESA